MAWEFWNTLTTQVSLPLRKPIYDLHSHTLHSTIKYELLVIVTREHTKMIQAHTNYSYFQLPSSSPAGSSSMPCQDMYIKGHQSNIKTSFFFFCFSISSLMERIFCLPPSVHQSQPQHRPCQSPVFSCGHPANNID